MGRTLTLCFTTRESGAKSADFVRLSSSLVVIPEPTDALETSGWFVNNVYKLSFNEPTGIAGIQGDIVVLEQHDCTNSYLRDTAESFPISSGVKAVLQSDGVAREYAIAQGKVNELPAGTYRVCFATKTSEGESYDDFRLLTKTVQIDDKEELCRHWRLRTLWRSDPTSLCDGPLEMVSKMLLLLLGRGSDYIKANRVHHMM